MSATPTVEERLSALEREFAQMKRQRIADKSTTDEKCWVDELSGSMKDIPHFEEFVRLGREARQAIREP